MKKYIFGLLAILFFHSGCVDDSDIWQNAENASGNVNVTFSVDIPAYTIATRATIADENLISSLWLLVFDEKGNYLYKKQAASVTPASTNPSSANGTFSVELGATTQKRVIHFIANYDLSNAAFADELLQQKDEREIVASLNGTGLYMWARKELNAINANTFQSGTVELLRSMAKITLIIDPAAGNDVANFSNGQYAVRRMPSNGTVAPFNARTYTFAEHTITEPAGVAYTGSSAAFRPLGENNASTEYTYERRNAPADNNYTCIILKGNYQGAETYYKIDILDANKKRYDIERNYWYKLTVRQILRPGYATEQQAMDNAAANNTSLDVTIEKYPIISDGVRKLEVEKTLITFSKNGSVLDTWAKYYPDAITNPNSFDNTGVTITLIEDDTDHPLVKNGIINFDPVTGKITAEINDIPNDGSVLTARIVIEKGSISRTIRLVGRQLYKFDPVTINYADPATINAEQNSDAVLRFSIPAEYPAELLPLEVRIYTQGLYPVQSGLRMEVQNGQICYIYTATTTGLQTLNFKTNISTSKEVVYLRADLFETGSVGYNINSITGNITYTLQTTTTPVPRAETDNLSAAKGFINVPAAAGVYNWRYPANLSPTEQVLISFRKQYSTTLTRVFSANVTLNGLNANSNINLTHTQSIVKGAITYGSSNIPVPAGSVTKVYAVSTNTEIGSVEVTTNGSDEFTYTISGTPPSQATVTSVIRINDNVFETYSAVVNFADLAAGGTVRLTNRDNIIIYGDITYGGASLVPIGQGTATSTPNYVTSYQTYQPGKYKLVLAGNTPESQNIVFRYTRGWTTYTSTRSLSSLRNNSTVAL